MYESDPVCRNGGCDYGWQCVGAGFRPAGSLSVALHVPLYAGLAVCSHEDAVTETAVLSNVSFRRLREATAQERVVESTLEVISVPAGERRIVYRAQQHFEAPNWSPDGRYLLFNGDGRLHMIPVTGGEPRLLDTGSANRCNNDHGFSPDGQWQAPAPGLVWQGCQRSSGESGCCFTDLVATQRQTPGAGALVRRAGHDQRSLLGAGQPVRGVRQLSLGSPLAIPGHPQGNQSYQAFSSKISFAGHL